MHNESLYRVVVDLREEREIFLQRLDQRLPDLEVDGSYLFDAVVENSYGCGPSLCQLTAGLNVHTGGLLTTLLEETWVMVGKAIRIAEQQADTQVKHLYPASWVRTRQTLEGLDMYYTQLTPEDPKRQTQVEGIDPEDQAYLDNVIASEIATEEAVEKAEADMGLNLQPTYVETTIEIPEPGSPEAEALIDRATDLFAKQYGPEVARSILDTGSSKAVVEQRMNEFLGKVMASRTVACPPGISHPDPTVTQEETDRMYTQALCRLEADRLADKFLGSVAEVVGDRASPAAMQRFAEQYNPDQSYWGQRTLQADSAFEAKLNEITHPNREMIDRVVREHNQRHTPSQSS